MKTEYKVIVLAIMFGLMIWVLNAALDYLFFYEGSFWDLLIFKVPKHEVYIRTLILGCFMVFGAIIAEFAGRRRRAEEALRRSEERFRSLFESMSEGVCMHEIVYDSRGNPADYRIIDVNPSYESITRLKRDDAVGVLASQLYGTGEAPFLDVYARVADTQEPAEFELFWPPIEKHLSVSVFSPGKGKFATVFSDVTKRKRIEEDLRRLNEELEERVRERTAQLEAANQELEAFAYAVSHDLRAPLRSMDGFSQALLEDHSHALDKEASDYLQRIRAGSQKMGQLIDSLLELSRVTRGKMNPEEVDLSGIISRVEREVTTSDPQRKAEFIIRPGLRARGDPRLLRAALHNLIRNAWKFTSIKNHARIEFGIMDDTDTPDRDVTGQPVYFVRDNGAGFDMTYADKLFGAFQRLHRAEEFPGSGIGLATVQRIIHRHGGKIWAEGTVNQGATFYFTLNP